MNLLGYNDKRPQCQCAVLPKTIKEDLGHRLVDRAAQQILDIRSHAECKRDVDG